MINLNFSTWFEQANGKRRLAIFDFDDTLVMTPGEEEGKARYHKATGTVWPHLGWWGRRETLKPPVFDAAAEPDRLHQKVAAEFFKAKADPNTQVILLTGRHGGQEKEIQSILKSYGLEPDEEYYQGHRSLVKHPNYPKKQNTWDFKRHIVTDVLVPRPGIEEVEMWDDRAEHIPHWLEVSQWIKDNYPTIKSVIFHDVAAGKDYKF